MSEIFEYVEGYSCIRWRPIQDDDREEEIERLSTELDNEARKRRIVTHRPMISPTRLR